MNMHDTRTPELGQDLFTVTHELCAFLYAWVTVSQHVLCQETVETLWFELKRNKNL